MSEWGTVPAGLVMSRYRKIAGVRSSEYKRLSLTLGGVVPRMRDDAEGLQPTNFEGYQVLPEGSLVFKLIDLENVATSRVGLSTETGIVSPAYIVVQTRSERLFAKFGYYAFWDLYKRNYFNSIGSDGVRSALNYSDLARIRIPLPPLETQQRIADYLDRETAEIDAAVAELDKYVELLRIRKSIFSNDSVWRNAAGRKRLKFLIDEVDERAGTDRTDWPLLSVSIHDGVNERLEDKTRIQASSDNLQNYKVVRVNDIVLNRMRAFQGALGRSRSEGITSPDYAVLRAHDVSAAEWIAHAMKTSDFINQITMRIRGIGTVDQGNARTPRINVAQLFDLEIPFPDADHREEIVDQLKREQEEMSLLLSSATKLRNLLLKRRSVLITDVVTGRKQV